MDKPIRLTTKGRSKQTILNELLSDLCGGDAQPAQGGQKFRFFRL